MLGSDKLASSNVEKWLCCGQASNTNQPPSHLMQVWTGCVAGSHSGHSWSLSTVLCKSRQVSQVRPTDGPVYRWLGVNVVFVDKTLGAPRPLGALLRDYDVHCEEGACSLSHDICRDSGDGVYEMQLVRSPWSSPPPSCNQCVLILTTAPRPSPTTDCTNSCSFSLSV